MNAITAFAENMEGPLPARRVDEDDVRNLENGHRRIDKELSDARGDIKGHIQECLMFRRNIESALAGLKQDHLVLRRTVLLALVVLSGIELFGGPAMMQVLLAKVGLVVTITHP